MTPKNTTVISSPAKQTETAHYRQQFVLWVGQGPSQWRGVFNLLGIERIESKEAVDQSSKCYAIYIAYGTSTSRTRSVIPSFKFDPSYGYIRVAAGRWSMDCRCALQVVVRMDLCVIYKRVERSSDPKNTTALTRRRTA